MKRAFALALALIGLTAEAQRLRGMAHGTAREQMRQRRHERNSRLRQDHLNKMALARLNEAPEDRNVTVFQVGGCALPPVLLGDVFYHLSCF